MGTMLQSLGLPLREAPEHWTLRQPGRVSAVHTEAALSGATWVRTNTFGANRVRLELAGLDAFLVDLNQTAVRLARSAVPDVKVMASVGPTASADPGVWERAYREQVEALASAEPDGFMIETIMSAAEGVTAVREAVRVGTGPVWASYTPQLDGCAMDGTSPERMAELLVAAGAVVVGVNCGYGPEAMLEPARKLVRCGCAPVLAVPNAGLPELLGGQAQYSLGTDAFAQAAIQFQEAGVRYFGGCCGTTPAHIRAAAWALQPSVPV